MYGGREVAVAISGAVDCRRDRTGHRVEEFTHIRRTPRGRDRRSSEQSRDFLRRPAASVLLDEVVAVTYAVPELPSSMIGSMRHRRQQRQRIRDHDSSVRRSATHVSGRRQRWTASTGAIGTATRCGTGSCDSQRCPRGQDRSGRCIRSVATACRARSSAISSDTCLHPFRQ